MLHNKSYKVMLTNALTTNNISLIAEKFKSGEITPYTRITANKTFIGYVIEAESDDPEYDINVKLNLIRLAHQYGADFNLPSKNYGNLSYLPLSNAFDLFSNLEKFKVVELLLQLGADPNKYVDNSFPVLFKKCDAELFKLLLDYRADANFIHHDDKIGNITPLYFNACDPIKVKILLQNNADPLFKNGYTQQTAYDFALEHYRNRSGSQESLQILQEAMVLAKQRKVTPSANQPELYKNAVLELERSLVSNERTTTAAIVGALRHMHNAELILTKLSIQPPFTTSSLLHRYTGHGQNLLSLAVKNGDHLTLKTLLDIGVSETLREDEALTPLMHAIYTNNVMDGIICMRHLIAFGVNLNERRGKSNDTAIFHAVLAKNLEAIKLLVEHGVDQTIINLAYDATPWTYAESNGFMEALNILTPPPRENAINHDKAELEEILTDVIELDKIKDPVIPANCGHTFDRASLSQHYNSGHPSSHDCPTCREPMKEPEKWTTNIMVSQILGMGMWKRRLNHQLQYQSGENQLRK